jgi:hypothetical protein
LPGRLGTESSPDSLLEGDGFEPSVCTADSATVAWRRLIWAVSGGSSPSARDYYGVSIKLDSGARPVSVTVAEASGGDQLVHSILREFVFDIACYVPPFVVVAHRV